MPKKIIALSPQVIAQIAAGEIVERPASVVKELVENSIDARATTITILLEDSGLKKITIIDDGHGMTAADIKLAIQSHTTSKLIERTDLLGIQTFGFRGEAMASIAQISHLTLNSRPNSGTSKLGYSLQLAAGEIVSFEKIGMPKGTQVVVENMFFNMPARKKFLKSKRVELNHCIDVITGIALAHPEIKFILQHNKKEILATPKQTRENRVKQILGADLQEHALPVQSSDPYITISGYITSPQSGKTSTAKQYIYVNNRRVHDKKIATTIKKTYATLLPKDVYPPFVVFISAPYETVDVNIHPKKDQVAFTNPKTIHTLLTDAVTDTLHQHNLIFSQAYGDDSEKTNYLYPRDISNAPVYKLSDSGSLSGTSTLLKKTTKTWITKLRDLPSEKIIQINNLYLATEYDSGMILVDQHAAHERILYEQFLDEFTEQKSQPPSALETPLVFELSIVDAQLLVDHLDLFAQQGFVITHTNTTFTITAAPKVFAERSDIKSIIQQLLDDIREENTLTSVDDLTHQLLKFLSCKAAIKAGDFLEPDERKRLLEKLETCKNPYTCPHGRPTKIVMTSDGLEKMFKRA